MEIEIYHVDQAINGSKEALGAIIENIEGPKRIVTGICVFNIKNAETILFIG